ncbi:MAG: hypothetical protein EAZ15_07295 [Sphingobacteriales bacterium]|nr:MAG: hypothetical protein EAZ15_07295 [Sphingobacteriales bacterium]
MMLNLGAKACDICGCFMGITPYDNQSSITLLHRYRSFGGYYGQKHSLFPEGAQLFNYNNQTNSPISKHNGNPSDYEIYRATEIRARYFLSKRIELNAILPYNSNSEKYNGNLNTLTGIGDANLFAGYHLLRKLDKPIVNQRLIVGLGIKLPTGKNDSENFEGIKFGTLHQMGTGSTDGFIYANYLMGFKKVGLSLSATYKVNGQNNQQESIANSTTSFLNFFYNVKLNYTYKMVPSAQFAYEYSAGEKYKGIKTGEHVMNNLMGGFGVDFFIKNITLNMALQTNVWAAKDDHPMPAGRLVLGVTYNFNQLYYFVN